MILLRWHGCSCLGAQALHQRCATALHCTAWGHEHTRPLMPFCQSGAVSWSLWRFPLALAKGKQCQREALCSHHSPAVLHSLSKEHVAASLTSPNCCNQHHTKGATAGPATSLATKLRQPICACPVALLVNTAGTGGCCSRSSRSSCFPRCRRIPAAQQGCFPWFGKSRLHDRYCNLFAVW